MKQNPRNRFNGRHNNVSRSSRGVTIFRNTSLESSGPCGKLRGTALQLHEKYLTAAKDALIQNDEVLAETCLQYADHYMHVQNIAIANEKSLRPQQPEKQPETQSETPVVSDTEPVEEKDILDEPKNEDDLKVIDLSVPVEQMNSLSELPEQETEKVKKPIRRRFSDKKKEIATEQEQSVPEIV